jgi:hypothetical protein
MTTAPVFVSSSPRTQQVPFCNKAHSLAQATLIRSGAYALGAWVFTPIHPIAGFIVGLVSYPCSRAIDWACQKIGIAQNDTIAKTIQRAFSSIASIGLGTVAAQCTGLPITFTAAVLVHLAAMGIVIIAGGLAVIGICLGVVSAMALIQTQFGQSHPSFAKALDDLRKAIKDIGENFLSKNQEISQILVHFRQASLYPT